MYNLVLLINIMYFKNNRQNINIFKILKLSSNKLNKYKLFIRFFEGFF